MRPKWVSQRVKRVQRSDSILLMKNIQIHLKALEMCEVASYSDIEIMAMLNVTKNQLATLRAASSDPARNNPPKTDQPFPSL